MNPKLYSAIRSRIRLNILTILLFTGSASFFSGCSKETDNPDSSLLDAVSYPLDWILTIDQSGPYYRYLYIPHYGGILIMRANFPKTYSINELVEDANCTWLVNRARDNTNSSYSYNFRSKEDNSLWWHVSKTYSPFGEEEFYLGIHKGNNPPNSDSYKFMIHERPKQNGNPTVVIESVLAPKHYLSNTGHTLSGNGVKLVYHEKPEQAQHFEIQKTKGTGIGSN